MKDINQQWVDSLKSQPLDTQVIELCKVLNGEYGECDIEKSKPFLLEFSDLLKDIKVANKALTYNYEGDFIQSRVDEVMRMRGLK